MNDRRHGRLRDRPERTEPGATSGAPLLLGIGLIDSVGTGLYLAGSVVYFSQVLGLDPTRIGVGLSLAGILGLVAQGPIGRCADRWGPRRVLVMLNIWRALGFTGYVLVDDFTGFLLVAAMLGIAEQAVFPIYQALVEQVVGRQRRVSTLARVRVVYNVGFTLGALLTGVALAVGTRAALDAIMLGNALTFVVAAAVLPRVRLRPRQDGYQEVRPASTGRRLRPVRDRRYVAVAAVNGILTVHISLLGVAVPLLVTTKTSAPHVVVSALITINTVIAVLMQIRASRSCETVKGSVNALRRASAALAAACAFFAAAPIIGPTVLVVATLVLGIIALSTGELLQSAGGWGLSYALAPDWSRAEYLATFNLGTSLQFIVGPTLVTVGVVNNGALGWSVLGVGLLVAGMVAGPLAAAAARRPALA